VDGKSHESDDSIYLALKSPEPEFSYTCWSLTDEMLKKRFSWSLH